MRVWILLALACVLARPPCVRAQELDIRRYSTGDGLPAAQTLALLQDHAGYLWFGTTAGLARYDGSEFRTWSRADGLRGNTVTALAATADGRMLVGLREGGVDVFGPTGIAPLAAPGLGDAAVRALVDLGDGSIWILTERQILRLEGGQVQRVVPPADLGLKGPWAVVRDRQGTVWIGADSGLYRLVGAAFEHVIRGVPEGAVRGLLEDASGGLWLGTDSGIMRQRGDRFAPVIVEGRGVGPIQSATRAPDGTLWFCGADGAVRVRSGVATRLSADSGLGDNHVNAAMVDQEGGTWFATDGGVAKLLPSSFSTFTRLQGLPSNFVVDLAQLGDTVWAATRAGVARLGTGSRFRTDVTAQELGAESISTLAPAPGGLVIGSSAGVHLWTGQHLRELSADIRGTVSALVSDPDGLWIGTDVGLWLRSSGGSTERQPDFDGVMISDLVSTPSGELWVATVGHGLFVRQGEGFTARLPEEVPADTTIWGLSVAPDGSVWGASNGAGAVHFVADGRVVRLTRGGNGLASDFVQQVLARARGRVWLYTNRGLDIWDPAIGITHFDLDDGLVSMTGTPGAALAGADGALWFGTPAGLVRFDGTKVASPGLPPVVVIQEIEVDGAPVGSREPLQLGPGPATIAFGFTALSFRNESGTRFQHRLLGRGSDGWSRPGTERSVAFSNLAPGSYRFEVQAISDRGLWSSEPASIGFAVRPELWQIREVRIGAVTAALLLVGAIFRSRFRKVEDERKRLRSMVDRRTRELVEKNTLLERMATTDELTALPNRRFFLESMERELRKMTRLTSEQPLSLLVIDLDRFKRINDRFGHAAGDEVLRQAARRLGQGVRATDLAARYGGEEFAILLPNTNPAGAHFLAEKLRVEIEQADFRFNGTRIDVTISVGVATVAAPQRYDAAVEEELLRRADEAMYRAKTGGRNRVAVAD